MGVSIKRSFVDPINQAINCAPVSPEQTREASQTKGLFVKKNHQIIQEDARFWQWLSEQGFLFPQMKRILFNVFSELGTNGELVFSDFSIV